MKRSGNFKREEKTYRINDIWYRGNRGNMLDLESLDPEEVKYALLTDIEAIAVNVIKKELKVQQRKIDALRDNIKTLGKFTDWQWAYARHKELTVTPYVIIKGYFPKNRTLKTNPTKRNSN